MNIKQPSLETNVHLIRKHCSRKKSPCEQMQMEKKKKGTIFKNKSEKNYRISAQTNKLSEKELKHRQVISEGPLLHAREKSMGMLHTSKVFRL